VIEALRATEWGEYGFEVTWPDHQSEILRIIFMLDPRYSFTCSYTNQDKSHLATEERPGDRHETDTYTGGAGEYKFMNARLASWLDHVRQELESKHTIGKRYDDFKALLEKMLYNSDVPLDDTFTELEQNALRTKLDKLIQDLEALQAKNEMNEQELQQAREEIERLQAELEYEQRGTWYRRFIYGTISISEYLKGKPVIKTLLLEVAKTAVQETVKGYLTEGSTSD
jgi:dynactin complex subunit